MGLGGMYEDCDSCAAAKKLSTFYNLPKGGLYGCENFNAKGTKHSRQYPRG